MKTVERIGMVIGVKEDQISEYRALHADDHPGVRDLLNDAHIRNFSIFLARLADGKPYLFGYYEYDGADYAADMARLESNPRNRSWIDMTAPMQIPLPGETAWKVMEPVYYNAGSTA